MRATCCTAMLVGACAFNPPSPGGPVDASTEAECADSDGDGVCNDVDDWPCGAKPAVQADRMEDSAGDRVWTAEAITIGEGRHIVLNADALFAADFRWMVKVNCPGTTRCPAQLEFGYGATRSGCLRGGDVFDDDETRGAESNRLLRAPVTPGSYELRLNAGQRETCGTEPLWYGGDPGSESMIAFVCVRP